MIGDRWGVSDAEISRPYPCDEFMRAPSLQAWRGVGVAAPPEAVWPWVAQVRIAPYSYDWIDNRGRRSPRELADLAEPRVGESFTATGGRAVGRIVSVEAGKQLTGTIMGAYMSYVLLPVDRDSTRLLLKVVMRTSGLTALGLCVGDLIMSRRQLLNLKRLAERHRRETLRAPVCYGAHGRVANRHVPWLHHRVGAGERDHGPRLPRRERAAGPATARLPADARHVAPGRAGARPAFHRRMP